MNPGTPNPITILDIQRQHKGHFFSPGTMKYFKSRILETVFQGPGGIFFVTSERAPFGDALRKYTVRQFHPDTGTIDTFGDFNQLTKGRALKLAKEASEMAKEKPE